MDSTQKAANDVPRDDDPANAAFWRNRCYDCGHLGHIARNAKCGVEKVRRDQVGLTRKIAKMTREREVTAQRAKERERAILKREKEGLAEKDLVIANKDLQLAEKDRIIADDHEQMTEKDQLLTDCQRKLAESEWEVERLRNLYEQ